MNHTSKTPPIVIVQRYINALGVKSFYSTMFYREDLDSLIEKQTNWREFAACMPLTSEPSEQNALGKSIAIAAKHKALVFQLSQEQAHESQAAQLRALCQLYDMLLMRRIPSGAALLRWREMMMKSGVLPYGQPYTQHSTYHGVIHALVPSLRGIAKRVM